MHRIRLKCAGSGCSHLVNAVVFPPLPRQPCCSATVGLFPLRPIPCPFHILHCDPCHWNQVYLILIFCLFLAPKNSLKIQWISLIFVSSAKQSKTKVCHLQEGHSQNRLGPPHRIALQFRSHTILHILIPDPSPSRCCQPHRTSGFFNYFFKLIDTDCNFVIQTWQIWWHSSVQSPIFDFQNLVCFLKSWHFNISHHWSIKMLIFAAPLASLDTVIYLSKPPDFFCSMPHVVRNHFFLHKFCQHTGQ